MSRRDGNDPLSRLFRLALRERALMLLSASTLALLALSQLFLTWLIKDWVEGPVLGHAQALPRALVLRAIATALVGMTSLFASRYALAAASQRLLERLRNDALAALLAAPPKVIGKIASGEWLSRLFNDVNALSGFLSIVVRRLVTESIILAGAITLMFVLSWRVTLATMLVVPIAVLVFTRMGSLIRRWAQSGQEAAATLTATVNEQLRGLTTIRGHQAEALAEERVREEGASLRRTILRGEIWSAVLISAVFLLAGAAFMAILFYGTFLHPHSAAEQAAFLAFCLYAGQTVEPARRLGEVHGLLQQSMAAAVRVFEVIDLVPEQEPVSPQPIRDGSLRCENVWFGYREDEVVLRDLTFRVDDGELVGLVGASGCGKTTLARFLARFEEPRAGRVVIGGAELREIAIRDLRSHVCLVEQEPFVFGASLLDNIRLGRPDASRAIVVDAARRARLESVIEALPKGLGSRVNEAGRDLSGGERQRIALARAIVRDPRILVLDEATSSIDSEAEAAIFSAMLPWLRRRTVLVVSHRLSTVSRLPRVLLLDGGRIVADGDPATLARQSVAYRTLFDDQLDRPAVSA